MTTKPTSALRIPFLELVAITAAVMALNALAIDMMLPALGLISEDLVMPRDNDRQLIIVVYVLANGFAQLFFGPLVDRFGRKRVLMWSFAGYIIGSLLSVIASSFVLLLAARAFQGLATAGARVASIAIVRDQCSGRRMAEVMSLAITIFMAAPILAPAIGQMILLVAPWRWIFVALLIYGAALALWAFIRLPETMASEDRRMLSPSRIAAGYREFVSNRISLGYTLASAMCFGALFGYISASEQIFLETFHLGDKFALAFAGIAGALGVATLLNARIVSRFGMRRLTHSAILLFISANAAHLVAALAFGDSLIMFIPFMMVSFFALGLIGPNATALAMDPMGHNAGAAAAANGFAGTTLAGFLGGVIGAFYDGTTMPIIVGFVMLGLASLLLVFWTEKGALFGVGKEQAEPAE